MADYPQDGTIPEVLDWVGDDTARAQQALDAEEGSDGQGRVTLVSKLEEVIDGVGHGVKPSGSVAVSRGPDQSDDDPDLASADIANRNS